MRALTIRQPWAAAIAHGTKRTENRTWTTRYRGILLIHAGAARDRHAQVAGDLPDTRSAVIAVATLTGTHWCGDNPDQCCPPPWGMAHLYHWQLADVRALPEPVPCKGRLGLWTPDPDVLDAVTAQHTTTR